MQEANMEQNMDIQPVQKPINKFNFKHDDNINKVLRMEFLTLMDKNPMKDYQAISSTNNFWKSTYQQRSFAFKMKSVRTMHKYASIVNTNYNKKLVYAAMTNNVELVHELLKTKKVDPNIFDEFLRTPLHIAAARGYENVVKLLLMFGSNVNKKDSLGNTALHLAVLVCNQNCIRFLVEGGANVNILDSNKKTPLDLVTSKYKSHCNLATNRFGDLFGIYTLLCSKQKNIRTEEDMKALFENLSLQEENKNIEETL